MGLWSNFVEGSGDNSTYSLFLMLIGVFMLK